MSTLKVRLPNSQHAKIKELAKANEKSNNWLEGTCLCGVWFVVKCHKPHTATTCP